MAKSNKVTRSFFLFSHTMLLLCMAGYYTVYMPTRPAGGFLCVVTAHGVFGVFFKPVIVSMFYGTTIIWSLLVTLSNICLQRTNPAQHRIDETETPGLRP